MKLSEAKTATECELVMAALSRQRKQSFSNAGLVKAAKELSTALIKENKSPLAKEAQELLETVRDFLDGFDLSSPTLSILATRFVTPTFDKVGPIEDGVKKRFLTETAPPPINGPNVPRRTITSEQVTTYDNLRNQIISAELTHGKDYYFCYHAQDPRMRIAQDLYRKVVEKYLNVTFPKDFYFFRFPGPNETTFSTYKTATELLVDKILETGMVDDNDAGTKLHMISVNLSLFGSLGHAGEETFHYFQIGKGQTPLDPTAFVKGFFEKFGYDPLWVPLLIKLGEIIDTTEGSMFQIMIPQKMVDDVLYMAHPHGLPFDDELLDDLHYIGDIRYRWSDEEDEGLKREKMNDELTRKLKLFPHRPAPKPKPLKSALKKKQEVIIEDEETIEEKNKRIEDETSTRYRKDLDELTRRTVTRALNGYYRPSLYLDDFGTTPEVLQDKQLETVKNLAEKAPDHIGHGKKSPHELMRIQNRALFMQARLLLSTHNTLNPTSGIKIIRHTTASPKQMQQYEDILDRMCKLFIKPKPLIEDELYNFCQIALGAKKPPLMLMGP